jgi:hypothetical protein
MTKRTKIWATSVAPERCVRRRQQNLTVRKERQEELSTPA